MSTSWTKHVWTKRTAAAFVSCLPMWLVTIVTMHLKEPVHHQSKPLRVLTALAVSTNTLVRIAFPSSYVPASQSVHGFLASPVLARVLATVAEVAFYDAEAVAMKLPFWGGVVGLLTLVGETLCWMHLILQSELLGWVEDCTWTLLQLYVTLFSPMPLRYVVAAPFVIYMVVVHLPRMLKRLERPWFRRWTGSKLAASDDDTIAWVVPSLLCKAVCFALFNQAEFANAADSSNAEVDTVLMHQVPTLLMVLVGALVVASG